MDFAFVFGGIDSLFGHSLQLVGLFCKANKKSIIYLSSSRNGFRQRTMIESPFLHLTAVPKYETSLFFLRESERNKIVIQSGKLKGRMVVRFKVYFSAQIQVYLNMKVRYGSKAERLDSTGFGKCPFSGLEIIKKIL